LNLKLTRVDDALYQAKDEGRNKEILFEEPNSESGP